MASLGCRVALSVGLALAGFWTVEAASAPASSTPRAAAARPRPAKARAPRPRATSTPRPEPTATPRPPDDPYHRLRHLPAHEIDRLRLLESVYFDEASAQIRKVDEPVLEKNAAILVNYDFLDVTLEAHCDTRGDVDYNMRLGEQRVKAVLKRLVALGVEPSRLRTVSFGKEVPVCTTGDEECRARSRRVELVVTGKRAD